jgi:outer membrane protein OmpA-like peptidoglycan-associated protein
MATMSTTETTSYSFRVLNADGSVFGQGCFTHEGPPTQTPLAIPAAGGPNLTALWYRDSLVGIRELKDVRGFTFAPGQFSLELSNPENTQGLKAGGASPARPGAVSRHWSGEGDYASQGRTLEFPRRAEPTLTVEEGTLTVPAVDLVVVIDASQAMEDEADSLSGTVSAAIKAARTRCPSDLRVVYLGIEGTFEGTLFDTTVRDYLTRRAGADEAALKGRRFTWVAGGKVREDGARAIEDVSNHFDWRPEAQRALFLLGDEGLDAGGEVSARGVAAATRAIETAQEAGVRVHTYLGTTKARVREALESEYARVARETGGQSFTVQKSLSGVQSMLESVICGSKSKPRVTTQAYCCGQAAVEDFPAPKPAPLPVPEPKPKPTTGTTSYTFRVLNADGSLFGKGCFTHEGPPSQSPIAIPTADGPKLTALWYHDSLVGTLQLKDVRGFSFAPGEFSLEFSNPDNTQGLKAGSASSAKPGPVSIHRSAEGEFSNQGRTLEFPQLAASTTTLEEGTLTVPAVDLVVVIDSSVSMKDEAKGLSKAVSAAIEAAKSSCPSDLRVTYLGIEGIFKRTLFETTVRDYLTQKARVDGSALKGRLKGTVENGGAQEDGARAVEDVVTHFDWRPEARRALFFLGDEGLEGGDPVDAEDIAAATRAIEIAQKAGVRVHTYLGTGAARAKAEARRLLESEYARVARETRGQSFTAQDSLSGFQSLLEKVICGSKSDPRVTTQEYCCCQAAVEELPAPAPLPAPALPPAPELPPAPLPVTPPAPELPPALLPVIPPLPELPPVTEPAPEPAPGKVVVEKGRLRTLEKVSFDTDKDTAVAESLPILDQVFEVLQANLDIKKLRIEVHTDNAGSKSYNQDLSTRQASWVRQYLIQKGIAAERLESAGFGLSKPIDTNATSEGRANNRRVEFVIVE